MRNKLVSTKDKRLKIANNIKSTAEKLGASITINEDPTEITISIKKGHYRISIDLDGKSHVYCFLAHWHTDRTGVVYPKNFDAIIGGSVNPYHYAKATTCEETEEGFLNSIENGLRALQSETA